MKSNSSLINFDCVAVCDVWPTDEFLCKCSGGIKGEANEG